ncbi:hypothetical protein F5X99DRAFT_107101 [Biscogniauxia marginata]|nr:hypothetical protein F5X99DRAFT_107101 [Biscogniauxia marginata]
MLRGRISRRDISICAFCQHRLSLRLATPRRRPFSNTRTLTDNGSSSSGWGPQRPSSRPLGPVTGGSWGTPVFAARKVSPSPSTPEPGHSNESQSALKDTPTSNPPPAGSSTDTDASRQQAPQLLLSEHERKAREILLAKRTAQEQFKVRYHEINEPELRSKHVYNRERQQAAEQIARNETKDLREISALRRRQEFHTQFEQDGTGKRVLGTEAKANR